MKEEKFRSTLMLVASMLIFGTIGIFRRYIPLSSGLLACARGVTGALFLGIFVRLKGKKQHSKIEFSKLLLLLLTGGLMGANWIFLFEAYNHTTVAVATLCYYMQPTIVVFLSPLIFGERLTAKKLLCAVISLLGMVFVSGIFSGNATQQGDFLGILFGLAAAVLYAAVVILNKKVQIDDAYRKTILQLASAALVLLPYVALTEDFSALAFTPFSLLMLLIVGIVHTGVAYALYFGSIKALKAQSIAVLSYIDPVSALILSALFLGERLSVFGCIGAALILGAAIFSELDFS